MSINLFIQYIGRLSILVLIQILLLNNIHISGLGISPYLYVLIILILPFETPGWLLLFFAAISGFIIDIFDDTGAMHMAALVLTAFLRPVVLKIISPRDGYDYASKPTIIFYGIIWFIKYSAILLFIHNFFFYFLEAIPLQNFLLVFLKTLLTWFLSVGLIILSQFLIFRK